VIDTEPPTLLRMAPPLVAVLSTNRQLLQVKTAPALTNTAPPLIAEPPLKLVKAPLYVAPHRTHYSPLRSEGSEVGLTSEGSGRTPRRPLRPRIVSEPS
jgi:hypothetical protein